MVAILTTQCSMRVCVRVFSPKTADPQGVTSAELSTHALSEAAADTTLEPPGSHEYVALKV